MWHKAIWKGVEHEEWRSAEKLRISRPLQSCYQLEYLERFWRPKGTCCHSPFSKKNSWLNWCEKLASSKILRLLLLKLLLLQLLLLLYQRLLLLLLIIVIIIRVFQISVSWWYFTGYWVTASLLKSPGLFSVFWSFSIMLLFG